MNKILKIILIIVGVLILLGLAALPIINSIYEEQSEKARDTTRIVDMMSIKSSIEQFYQDNYEYPSTLNDEKLSIYLYMWIPTDPKNGETVNWCTFWYKYEVLNKEWLAKNWYRLSTCLENKSNIETKAKNDWGIYDNKYELFID